MGVTPDGAAEAAFVVRDGGRWLLAPVPVSYPRVIGLDDVLSLLPARTDGVDGVGAPAEPLAGSAVVAPVWCWVGSVTASGVILEGNDAETVVLDRRDLRLLDALDRPLRVAELVRATGITEAPSRLRRLVTAGRLKLVGHDGAAGGGPEPAGPTTTPSRPSPTPAPRAPATDRHDPRVGVHAVWQEKVGPALSLGMLTASARRWGGGALNEHYDIHRPETPEQFLTALGDGQGPAILLCSNYLWSVDHNLEVARAAKTLCPGLVVIHGGPSTPKYQGDAERFLAEHGDVADILVRSEGEVTLCRILEALAPPGSLEPERLTGIAGLTFRDADGAIVRTPEPERIADLDALPSPYLTGEFDHIDPAAWLYAVSVETNRGCPYGCTFCDWGSATLSRIRKFDLDRVLAEFQWAADRGVGGIQICDANFGIMSRDVDIARGLADIHRSTGHPMGVGFTPPKNTTKHITRIFDAVMDAGLLVSTAISLQTIDEATLDAVDRSNISNDHYLALAADLRRRGHPLMGDLLLGLPAQTYASYKADLQFFIDHQIMARTWAMKVLPNSPMNAPDYRERYQIRTDEAGVVTATVDLDAAALARAVQLRRMEIIGQRLGVIRHLGLFLQWDHGIPMTDLLDDLIELTTRDPLRFPLITWVFEYFDLHPTAPVGWPAFYRECRRLLAEDYDLDPDRSDLDTVLALQTALMPAPERRFPQTIPLPHDYLAYHREATADLYTTGRAAPPPRPLAAYPPAPFTVTDDPLGLCATGLHFDGDSRDLQFEGDFAIGQRAANELGSPLMALLPVFGGQDAAAEHAAFVADGPAAAPAPRVPVGAAVGRRSIPVNGQDRDEGH